MVKYEFCYETKELSINNNKIDIPNYMFLEEIGHGANGIVIKSLDKTLSRLVAVKFWLPRKEFSYPDKDRFLLEIRKLAKLKSLSIVQIYSADDIDDKYFYAVLELCNGVTLKQWLKGNKSFDERSIILKRIYQEIGKVHEQKIYHGDLHSNNVLINDYLNIKILDFGTSFFARKYKTIEESRKREARLLLNTGLLILKEENTKYHFLDSIVLTNKLSPELIPKILLALNELISELEYKGSLKELDDYTKRRLAFSLPYYIWEIPFFNFINVFEIFKTIVREDEYIEWFIGYSFTSWIENIVDIDDAPIQRIKYSEDIIKILQLAYNSRRSEYIKNYEQKC
ncbi:MAG: protein kinase domain-containing protein [Methanosarcina sp.]